MSNTHTNKLYLMNYEDLLEVSFNYFVRNHGEKKLKTIYEKIMTSNNVSGLISKAKFNNIIPSPNDWLICINHIPYFLFSSQVTTAIGALMAFQRWNTEVNESEILINENELHYRAMKIIEISKAIEFIH